jgi:plasmid stabilization system protein ParE
VKVSLTESARRDIDKATAFYAIDRTTLVAEFLNEVERVLAALREYPRLGQRLDETYRCIQLRKFPYSLIYRIDHDEKLIHISVVGHQSRRPGFWRDRVEELGAVYLENRENRGRTEVFQRLRSA